MALTRAILLEQSFTAPASTSVVTNSFTVQAGDRIAVWIGAIATWTITAVTANGGADTYALHAGPTDPPGAGADRAWMYICDAPSAGTYTITITRTTSTGDGVLVRVVAYRGASSGTAWRDAGQSSSGTTAAVSLNITTETGDMAESGLFFKADNSNPVTPDGDTSIVGTTIVSGSAGGAGRLIHMVSTGNGTVSPSGTQAGAGPNWSWAQLGLNVNVAPPPIGGVIGGNLLGNLGGNVS